MGKAFTIQEVVARTGLSVHTLRYYERAGLLPPVDRGASGHRRYTADDLNWIAFLLRLRATGMSMRQMRAYADLRRQGDATASARLALLEDHQQQVREHILELEDHLTAIEKKMDHLNAHLGDTSIFHRQRLLAHSDLDRFYTYKFCEPFPYPIRNCVITLRVTPVVDGNRAFVEWSATFDCEATEYDHWTIYFANEVWAKALESLKKYFSHSK
jgi:DNA-binding transcriptional MerR regulator